MIKYDRCLVCNSKNLKEKFNKNSYKYVICNDCEFLFQNEFESKEKVEEVYNENYLKYEIKNQDSFLELNKKSFEQIKLFEIINEKKLGKNFLDIGCAIGKVVKYFQDKNFEAVGIDISKEMVEYGKKEFGVNLFSKDLFEMDFKENSFDVIHSSNVIEHIFDVKEWLLNINKILKNGGVFVLSTPNYNSFFAKLEKENWRNLSKNHIALFGKKNLKLLLENANFKILKHKTWGSFPKNSKYSKYKFLTDRLAKILNIGDMQLVLAVKG